MKLLVPALLLLALASSCIVVLRDGDWPGFDSRTIRGSGNVVEEARTVSAFRSIELDMGANVAVHVGREGKIVVRADDNLLPYVDTAVRNGVLVIRTHGRHSLRGNVSVEIHTPELVAFELDGAGEVTIDGIDAERFTADLDGAGSLRASGSTRTLVASIDGAGSLLLSDLEAQEAMVDIDGAGEIQVRAAGSLRYGIDGSGNITYIGTPRVSGEIDGVGSIRAR